MACASMGPPIYIGGNYILGVDETRKYIASMGPPIYIGGNHLSFTFCLGGKGSFNGATDLHRWKPPQPTSSGNGKLGFNGATDLHRWKRK